MNVRPGDPLLGQTLDDRYRIVRRIARGGMATVFEAVDERLSRTVAVKVMHAGLDADDEVAARFDSEARAAALLSHPNVVAVFDQGSDDGRPYIVMEYVRGITLRQLITLEAPFAPVRALQLFEPVVAALATAHDAGLIHRDIKPENVLISERGQVKVADFGLARNVTAATVAEGGVVIGTVSYIAPELVSRGHASTRSDVYSLGIVLYELLTGLKPYRADTPIEVAYAHVHRDVPAPSSVGRIAVQIPRFLDTLVLTTTTRSLARRQQDAGVLLRQVRGARDVLARGCDDAHSLDQLMRAHSPEQADQAAADAHLLVGAPRVALSAGTAASARSALSATPAPSPRAPQTARSAASAPGVPERRAGAREIRMAPSNVSSPTFDMVDDGLPYYSDAPEPISPYSPTRSIVPPPREWVQTPMHRRRRMVVGVAAAALVGALVSGSWWATAGRLPAAPHTVGLAQSDAQAAVAASGLTVQFAREYSDTVPAGVVTRTDPAEGARLAPGSVVIVYLSQGQQQFEVPALKGKTRDQALQALVGAGLTAGAITETYDKAAAGTVISQGAAVGSTLTKGAAVDFVLSRGVEPSALPSVVGQRQLDARRALASAGFKVKLTEDYSASVPAGSVISQDPASGQAERGSTVAIVVSKGVQQVLVPDVRRLTTEAATEKLQALGLAVTDAPSPTPASVAGTVVSTDPVAGRRVDAGSRVTIYVG